MLGERDIMDNINNWVTMQCNVGGAGLCYDDDGSGNYDGGISERSSVPELAEQTEGDGFWSNHVYVGLTAAIVLFMLVVCGWYYLGIRRNQQQTANERNSAEDARPNEQDAVNDLSIEDVEDYAEGMDADGENDARPNGESQPAVDGVARRNSIVTITLRCRN